MGCDVLRLWDDKELGNYSDDESVDDDNDDDTNESIYNESYGLRLTCLQHVHIYGHTSIMLHSQAM